MTGPGGLARHWGWQGWLIALALAAVSVAAWTWMIGASLNHHHAEPVMMFLDDMAMDNAAAVIPPRVYAAASVPMWFIMMMGMMIPTAVPMAAAHARHAREVGQPFLTTALFGVAYIAIWGLFAVAASIAQTFLVETGLILRTSLMVGSDRLAGLLLIAVGGYELTPLKFLFIEHCRAPEGFLARFWRPGPTEALVLGFRYAVYCVGCCWMLMALLFVGGAMSLAWAIGLTALVVIQKTVPGGRQFGVISGVVLLLTGVALTFRFF